MLGQEIVIQTDGFGGKKQRYIKKEKIGSGGFAKCYLLLNCRTQQKFAAKVIDSKDVRDKSARTKIYQQIQIHRQLNHQNVVRFYDTFEFEDQIYMIMQLCQNNTLKEFLKIRVRITQFEAKFYMHQIIEGLQYLHNLNIIHRDIKLGNLFLNMKMEVKIGDFGLSKQLKSSKQRRYTTCGTPNYIAPEILKEIGHSFQADIWALGIILYALLIGKPPFESDSVQNTYKRIKNNSYQFPKQIPLSNEARDLIKRILDPNPKTRIGLMQIKNHDFLNRDIQKIPKIMPGYTISIPPQVNFLKQYVNQKNMKLLILPKKVNDNRRNPFIEEEDKISKLSRIVSADKKLLLKLQSPHQENKEPSTLNRGRYLKILRTRSLFKNSFKDSKCVRSAASIGSSIGKKFQADKNLFLSPKKQDQDINQIICYYDISEKYGISFLLSNGNFGIIFNDRTSMTAILDPKNQNPEPQKFIYYEKKAALLQKIPENLTKKRQILKLCQQKLEHYRKNNVLIPYESETYGKKMIRFDKGFVIKLSNGIIQFFWGADSITIRNYRWVRWRMNQSEGEGKLSQRNFPEQIQQKIEQVKQFMIKFCKKQKEDIDSKQ